RLGRALSAGVGRARVLDAELPYADDVARRSDIDGWIAVDQQQVGAQACRDAPAVMEAEGTRRFGSRRGQSLRRREAGEDEQLQLAVEAHTMSEAGRRSVGAREDRYPRAAQ